MIRLSVALILLAMSSLCAGAYLSLYFKWRECFNALGRCFDPDTGVVYTEHSGTFWLFLTVLCLVTALYLFWTQRKERQARRSGHSSEK